MLRMRELARRSGVPSSTIKHYLREGLLPAEFVRTARNSALYDPALVERVVVIKEMQRTHFLPLWRIKEVLAGKRNKEIATVEAAVGRVLEGAKVRRSATRLELRGRGVRAEELKELERLGLIDAEDPLTGADLKLVETLIAAHDSGLTSHLDTVQVIREYAHAVRTLARAELAIFLRDVMPSAQERLAPMTEDAMLISQDLVILMRQRLLLDELATIEKPSGKRAKS